MKLLGRVEGGTIGNRYVRLVRGGRTYQLQTSGPRPGIRLQPGMLLAIDLPGCPAYDDAAITAWFEHAYRERPLTLLRRDSFALAALADFADALNAADHIVEARKASADALVGFARDRGGRLLAELRAALDAGAPPADLPARVRRFAMVCGGYPAPGEPATEASRVLDELAGQHDVEHLMGLEHAVARWVATASDPREAALLELAHALPDGDTSAGVSHGWFLWWWQLAAACTRVDLMTIVDRAVDLADDECTAGRREPIAGEARAEARRMASRMHDAPYARLWSGPPRTVAPSRPDLDDAHYTAFMAVTHAAHALAGALTGALGPRAANRVAMRRLAELAVAFLREELAAARG